VNRFPLYCLLAPFCLALPTHASAADRVVAFDASTRVEVDATGRPVKVEAPADLPQSVREFIEKRVASWHYSPAMQDGVAQAGTTYVWVGACAIPEGEGYRLAVDFKGNGPRHADGKPLAWPGYPDGARRRGVGGSFEVIAAIAQDGTTTPESVTPDQENERWNDAFRVVLEQWVRRMRFDPERVGGQGVASRIRIPVVFSAGGPSRQERLQHEEQTRSTDECRLATGAGAGPQPIALDSPIKVTPSS